MGVVAVSAATRLARMTGGARWIETAQPDRTRRTRSRSPGFVRAGTYSASLWDSEHEVSVRCVPTRPRTSSSPTEIAFALAGLQGAPLLMGNLILLGDRSSRGPLILEGMSIAHRMPWPKSTNASTLRGLVELAVTEVEHVDAEVSQRARARWLEIHHETWRRRYAPVYESRLFPTVNAWSGLMLEHVSRRL